jgi:polyhydroxyalkanoate synthase subunit PhaC
MTASAEELANGAGALDLLLSDAALGTWRRFLPWTAGMRQAAGLARRPDLLRAHGARLAREYGRIAVGRSHLAASPRDRRFAEPAWVDNPLLRAVMQSYLVTSDTAQRLVRDVELPWRDAERVRFAVDNLVEALAPSNAPTLNPLWWKALIDTGGRSAVRGARSLVHDLAQAPRVPTMVDVEQFRVGQNVAATPGAVVLHPGSRAHPVHADHERDRAHPAPDRPAGDQQVLHRRSGAGSQPHRVPRRAGATGLRDLVAQPGCAPPRVGF